MLVLLFIISLLVFIIALRTKVRENDNIVETVAMVSVFFAIAFFVATICTAVPYSEKMVIDKKVDLYKKQNEIIVKQIETCVKSYTDYEGGNYEKILERKSDSDYDFLLSYPEMKANTLFMSPVNKRIKNNDKIVSLKSKKISYEVLGFWFCFNLV